MATNTSKNRTKNSPAAPDRWEGIGYNPQKAQFIFKLPGSSVDFYKKVEAIKEIPGMWWDETTLSWRIPVAQFYKVITYKIQFGVPCMPDASEKLKELWGQIKNREVAT
ncbi:MAG: hypothetical protein HC874_14160 [Richelia sp. SL_2_1]|nr:hypothetical protein [Richelia sp. SL_2_1]